jgi:hypothetical protein
MLAAAAHLFDIETGKGAMQDLLALLLLFGASKLPVSSLQAGIGDIAVCPFGCVRVAGSPSCNVLLLGGSCRFAVRTFGRHKVGCEQLT